jgi:RNA polymerase sigma-70 factor, ECF subfamily
MERRSPSTAPVESRVASVDDSRLVEALSAGDEEAFVELVRRHGPVMLRIAQLYVPSGAVAEEVVQETWLGMLTGLEGFEGRSSFRTWLFRILRNRAQTRGVKEGRSVPFSALSDEEIGAAEPSVPADRFRGEDERFAHHWSSSPERWAEIPEASLLWRETTTIVEEAVAALPPAQRAVITLRDIVGFNAGEACELLEISDANQRVLLHRARAKVRDSLAQHLASA